MHILTDVSLKHYSTMRLGGLAKALVEVSTKEELSEAIEWADKHAMPLLMLGGGSNVIFSDGFNGLVIVNRLNGYEVIAEDTKSATIKIGAGEPWDHIVKQTVQAGLSGIEKLSLIPGTAGATPVQNVGAYGAEIAEVLLELEVYDLKTHNFAILHKDDCQFSYRSSIFKSPKNRRYIITSITLRLSKRPPEPPFYDNLQYYLDKHQITTYTPQTIRDAVIAVRTSRLPDPELTPNTGSFFKNPVISVDHFNNLYQQYPTMAHWPTKDGHIKVAAGWLIEQAGLKGYQAHGMKIYEKHALVLVNDSAKSYADLATFRQEIIEKVKADFGIILEQEPELI